eukprot:Colp12_sorted_trinity150504_noHs@33618
MMTDGDFLKTSCGSPNYAAPEVISGKLYAGPEVDVWSCGVILYALLCGKLPFDDEYIPNLFKKIKGGIFSLPSHLSEDTKQLLTSMLQVDPLRRATIEEIRAHPWFQVNLPAYLFPSPDDGKQATFDEMAARQVCEILRVTRDEVLFAVLHGDAYDPIKIAYHLVLDNRKLPQDTTKDPDLGLVKTETFEPLGLVPSVEDPSRKLEKIDRRDSSLTSVEVSVRATPAGGRKKRSKWHLGIRSRNEPHEVMLEVFRALKSLGFEWKIITPFHVLCRFRNKVSNKTMKMSLQLYKIDDRQYLLDFKILPIEQAPADSDPTGHTMEFFEMCSMLIRELAITS